MRREEILLKAKECVCGDREQDYGSAENNFQRIADFWNTYLGLDGMIRPEDVGVMMALLKIARIASGRFKEDSYVDCAGYIACAGEIGGENV